MLDPSKFIRTPSLPILSEGTEITLPDGESFRVTPEYLREVRDNMNRREENTGDLVIGCVGHLNYDQGKDETNQAPVAGYFKNWHIKPLGNSGRLTLHADEWLRREFGDVPSKFPRRSPDLWVKTKVIGPVAYLGATEPHQDLGLHPLSLSKQDDTVLRIPPMADEAASNKGDAKIEELLKQLVSAVTDLTAKVESLAGGGPQAPGAPEMSPEDAEKALNELLGGSGGGEGAPAPEAPKEPEKPKQMARDVADELAALKEQNEKLVVQMARAEVTQKVKDLKAKGFLIEDEDAEIKDLLALPTDMRPAQLARIERQYRRAPGTGVNDAVASANSTAATDVPAVIKHARTNGVDYDTAHKQLYGKFPGAK